MEDIISKMFDIADEAESDNCGVEAIIIRAAAVFVEHEPWKIMPATAMLVLHRGADVVASPGYIVRALHELAEASSQELLSPGTD